MNSELISLRPVINKNFLIRVTYPDFEVRLVGAGQYHKYVGETICLKHFKRVLADGLDEYTFKMRRGLRIEFVSK